MPRALMLALLVLLAAPATGGAAARCAPRHGERTLARSAEATVLQRYRDVTYDGTLYSTVQTILGCSRSTGRRRVITRKEVLDTTPGEAVDGVRLAGTRVAYVASFGSKDGSHATGLVADDAVHRGRRHDLTQLGRFPFANPGQGIAAWAVGRDGTVAWVARGDGDQLVVWRPSDDLLRRFDVGFDLGGPVTLTGGTVRWRHAGADRVAPLTPPPSRCGGAPARAGTPEVDLTITGATLTACLRATGQTLTVAGHYASYAMLVDVAGPYVALSGQGAIARLDLTAGGVAETIPARGMAYARVDAAGSLAWVDQPDAHSTALWVRDAAGTRQIGGPVPLDYRRLARDGAVVRDGLGTFVTLAP